MRHLIIVLSLLFSGFALQAKELKTLILIIATDNLNAYKELQKVWEAYMNKDPDHFEVYFMRADPELKESFSVKRNEITVKTEESFVPGIVNKTIMSLEAMASRLDEFDYVIRTNLSSFFPFDNLLKYLNKLPRENCYAGIALYQPKELGLPPGFDLVPFVSGAGIIWSKDVAKMLIDGHAEYNVYKKDTPDDVFLGLFFQEKKVPIICACRWDYPTYAGWLEGNHQIEEYAYHFRAKSSYFVRKGEDSFKDELCTLKALLQRYYDITLP